MMNNGENARGGAGTAGVMRGATGRWSGEYGAGEYGAGEYGAGGQGQENSRPTLLAETGLAETGFTEAGLAESGGKTWQGESGSGAAGLQGPNHADDETACESLAREGEADADNADKANQVPDSPEGYAFAFAPGVEVDEQALEAFKEVAFEQGISQQQASQIAQLYAGLMERQQEEQRATLDEAEAGWLKELKHGRNYAGTVASARLAMERFGTPELNALLNETRLGSHPALVRFVASVGRELGEPVFVQGKGSSRPQRLNFYETMEG